MFIARGFQDAPIVVRQTKGNRMRTLCYVVASAALLISAPAMAQQFSGGGSTSLWSSAQGTSDSYGNANGFATSTSGSIGNAGGLGFSSLAGSGGFGGGAATSAMTTSTAGASTSGNGYAQVQTSGYAGGNVAGFGARTR
jgi:hypothetical protein